MEQKRIASTLLCFFCTAFFIFPSGSKTKARAIEEEASLRKGIVTVTAEVKDEEDLLAFDGENPPDSALITVSKTDAGLAVVDGEGKKINLLSNVMSAFAVKDIVPVAAVYDEETAFAAAEFFRDNNVVDAVLLSDDGGLLYKARRIAAKVAGALEVTDVNDYKSSPEEGTYETAIAIRDAVNTSWARAVILPAGTDNAVVDRLFELCVTVWIRSDGTPAENFGALVNGCHGIVTENYAAAKRCLETAPERLLTRAPQIVAHGGMPVNYQPNSLRGYQDAYENGKADVMENDLHMTKDGVVVLLHGTGVYGEWGNGDFIDDIASQTTGTGKIHEMTWNQLKQYKVDGYKAFPQEPILDLNTYLDYFRDKPARHFMELKRQMQTDIVAPVVEGIKARGMEDRMNIITYWDVSAREMRKQLPEASVMLLVDNGSVIIDQQKTEKEGWMALLEQLNPDNLAYSPNYKTFSQEQMYQLARRGIQTFKWTYGDVDDFEAAYIDNYNTLTTDYALWAKEFDVEMEYGEEKISMGANADEGVYVRGDVTDKSGNVRKKAVFDLQVIEGDLKLSKTSGGKYYADKPGTARAIVTYESENTFDYILYDGKSGRKTISYTLCSPRIVEIEATGAGGTGGNGNSSQDTDSNSSGNGSQSENQKGNSGCGAASAFLPASVLTVIFAAILLKKRAEKDL